MTDHNINPRPDEREPIVEAPPAAEAPAASPENAPEEEGFFAFDGAGLGFDQGRFKDD